MGSVLLGLRLVLAAVFATAGIAKLLDRPGSRKALLDFGVAPRAAAVLAPLIPLAELLVAVALIPSSSARWGALGALALLLAFIVGIANALMRGREPDCHCFGQLHSAPAGRGTLARNAVLATAAAVAAWQGPGPGLGDWLAARTAAEIAAVATSAAAAVLAAQTLRLWSDNRSLRADLASARSALASGPRGLPKGAAAPHFALAGVRGGVRSLDALLARGRPVVLVFVDLECGPCQELLPKVGGWQETLADRLTLVVVSHGSAKENRRACEDHGLADVLLQKRAEVFEAYGVRDTPSAVVVSADGRIASVSANTIFQIEALIRLTISGATVRDWAARRTAAGSAT